MRVSLAVSLATYELKNFPELIQAGWKVTTSSRARNRLGQCHYAKKEIILSESFITLNEPEKIREVVLHEIAHALTPGHGHDAVWKAKAKALGISGDRCDSTAVVAYGKYVAICHRCEKIVSRSRPPAKHLNYHCRTCGETAKPLVFVLHDPS